MPYAEPENATYWILIFEQRDTSDASLLAENKITRYFALKQNVTFSLAKQVSSAAGNIYFSLDKSLSWPEERKLCPGMHRLCA